MEKPLSEEKYLLLEQLKESERANGLKDTLIDKQAQDISEKNNRIENIAKEKAELEKKHSDEITALKIDLEAKATIEQERDSLKIENENLKTENGILKSGEEKIESMSKELQELKSLTFRLKRENFSLTKEMTDEVQPYVNEVETTCVNLKETIASMEKRVIDDSSLMFLKLCKSDVALNNLLKVNPKQVLYSRSELRAIGFPPSILREKEFEKGGLATTNFHVIQENGTDKYRVTRK